MSGPSNPCLCSCGHINLAISTSQKCFLHFTRTPKPTQRNRTRWGLSTRKSPMYSYRYPHGSDDDPPDLVDSSSAAMFRRLLPRHAWSHAPAPPPLSTTRASVVEIRHQAIPPELRPTQMLATFVVQKTVQEVSVWRGRLDARLQAVPLVRVKDLPVNR